MAGFDSATEKDRRMRNQKKDPAVLLKLEANSQLVTRTEEVLNTNLDYQRTRDVYDEPSIDGSGVNRTTSLFTTTRLITYRTKTRLMCTRPDPNVESDQSLPLHLPHAAAMLGLASMYRWEENHVVLVCLPETLAIPLSRQSHNPLWRVEESPDLLPTGLSRFIITGSTLM